MLPPLKMDINSREIIIIVMLHFTNAITISGTQAMTQPEKWVYFSRYLFITCT